MSSFSFWRRIRRTPYQAFASVFMVFLTICVMALFLLVAVGSSAVLSFFESKPQVTVYFTDEKNTGAIEELANRLKSSGKVANITYISKEQALAKYREDNKNDPLLLEMVTAEILPSSMEISATEAQYLEEIATTVKNEPDVDEVVFLKDVVDSLIAWTGAIRKVGVVFVIFLILETVLILLTIIGMHIALKKEEIEILRLVGATPWYIRKPFLMEGIAYGIFGSTLAWAMVTGLVFYFRPFIASFLQGIPSLSIASYQGASLYVWPLTPALFLALWIVLSIAGCLIGLTGSSIAVSRYLK